MSTSVALVTLDAVYSICPPFGVQVLSLVLASQSGMQQVGSPVPVELEVRLKDELAPLEDSLALSRRLSVELPCDSSIPLLGIRKSD